MSTAQNSAATSHQLPTIFASSGRQGAPMAVFVDPLRKWGGSAEFRWKKSSHMYVDPLGSVDELHALAAKIGMRRQWFQDDKRLPHYDLNPRRRAHRRRCRGAYPRRDEDGDAPDQGSA